MALPSSISTGKKSNTSLSVTDQDTVNQAVQDEGVAISFGNSPGAIVNLTDAGAIRAGENIAGDAFAFAESALGAFGDIASSFTRASENIARGGLDTANIRSQLPSETLSANNSELFRVAIIAAGAVAVAFFVFKGVG